MKTKLIISALLALMCMTSYAEQIAQQETKKTTITIRKRLYPTDNRDSFGEVTANLNHDSQCIEIELLDTGLAEIYIVDSANKVVDYTTGDSNIVLDIPSTPGVYTIVIWSDKYYGEGTFTIN